MGNRETLLYLLQFGEASLHVITQSDFLSWDLQNFIDLMSLIIIS